MCATSGRVRISEKRKRRSSAKSGREALSFSIFVVLLNDFIAQITNALPDTGQIQVFRVVEKSLSAHEIYMHGSHPQFFEMFADPQCTIGAGHPVNTDLFGLFIRHSTNLRNPGLNTQG